MKSSDDFASARLKWKAIGGQDEGEHGEGEDLRGVGFRRGHSDLRSGVDVNSAVSLAWNGRADGVGDAHGQGAAWLAIAQGVEGVGRLAGLRDEEANVVPVLKIVTKCHKESHPVTLLSTFRLDVIRSQQLITYFVPLSAF